MRSTGWKLLFIGWAGAQLACGVGELEPEAGPSLGVARQELFKSNPVAANTVVRRVTGYETKTQTGERVIIVSAVHRTPSGSCALGNGNSSSSGFADGVMADINKCKDFCGPGAFRGATAADDGAGGCKLMCDCGGGYLDFVDGICLQDL